jgi:hypothetical protein
MLLRLLWKDEGGAVLSAELIMIMTLLLAATAVGISTLRNALVTELADVAAAIGSLNQSYTVGGITGHHSGASAQAYSDAQDACDNQVACAQSGTNSQCLAICTTGSHGEEGGINDNVPNDPNSTGS